MRSISSARVYNSSCRTLSCNGSNSNSSSKPEIAALRRSRSLPNSATFFCALRSSPRLASSRLRETCPLPCKDSSRITSRSKRAVRFAAKSCWFFTASNCRFDSSIRRLVLFEWASANSFSRAARRFRLDCLFFKASTCAASAFPPVAMPLRDEMENRLCPATTHSSSVTCTALITPTRGATTRVNPVDGTTYPATLSFRSYSPKTSMQIIPSANASATRANAAICFSCGTMMLPNTSGDLWSIASLRKRGALCLDIARCHICVIGKSRVLHLDWALHVFKRDKGDALCVL